MVEDPGEGGGGGNGVEGGVCADLEFQQRTWGRACGGVAWEGVEWVVSHGGGIGPVGAFEVKGDGDIVG